MAAAAPAALAADEPASSPRPERPAGAASAPAAAPARWVAVPAVQGRIAAAQLGLVINTEDPYAVAVGERYARRRGLSPAQVLRVALPVRPVLTGEEFERLRAAIASHFGGDTHALAFAWREPYRVGCQSLGGALVLGLDPELCTRTCGPTPVSPLFGSASSRPFFHHGVRPVMHLAAPDADAAFALIERGIAADGSLQRRGRPPATVLLAATEDPPRRVRMRLYPPPGLVRPAGLDVRIAPPAELAVLPRVIAVQTGAARLDLPAKVDWLPGALADHLTSSGGALAGGHGQSTVLDWIASGATASHGSVTEPCNHLQKFPHPQLLLQFYAQGASAIEAYWKSVAWPSQALFAGEPLAAPFAPATAFRAGSSPAGAAPTSGDANPVPAAAGPGAPAASAGELSPVAPVEPASR